MKKFIRFQFTINDKNYFFLKESLVELPLGTQYSPNGQELYFGVVTKFKFNEKDNIFLTCILNDHNYNKKRDEVPVEFIIEMMKNAGWELLPEEPDGLDV
ncbi:MAG: hypothetical protein KBD48_00200 [Candidatus Pacebacteria bacterium]|nr:hypothetical protein [Candidatus Paceibacterota bacterium]MBP9715601.1 hypothetical protein [Candidatus Paceibacterota bacterium]